MKLLADDTGITYGIVMFFIALVFGIFVWMFVGILIDLFEELYNSLAHMMSPTLGAIVTDSVNIYASMPFLMLGTAVIFLIIRGLRRNSDEPY